MEGINKQTQQQYKSFHSFQLRCRIQRQRSLGLPNYACKLCASRAEHPTVGVAKEIVWIIVIRMEKVRVLQCYRYANWNTKGVQCNGQASILPSMDGVRIARFDFLARHFLACQTLGRAKVEGCFVGGQPKPYTMPIAYSALV